MLFTLLLLLKERFEPMTCSRFRTTLIYSTLVLFAGMPLFAQGGERTGPDQGAQLYGMNCAYCHGAGGQGGRATALTGPNVIALSDQDLIGIVHNGEAAQGMPAFPHLDDDETQALVRYLRTVQGVTGAATVAQLPGDPNAGRELFFGKGQCSTCHMIDGQGGFMAPELTAYAQYRTAGDIVQAIVNPDANLAPTSRVAEVRTRGGQKPDWHCARGRQHEHNPADRGRPISLSDAEQPGGHKLHRPFSDAERLWSPLDG